MICWRLSGATASRRYDDRWGHDAEVFSVYVEQVLRSTLHAGDIVIMDNLRAHKASGICEAIEQAGAQVVYLPLYSLICRRSNRAGLSSRRPCAPPRPGPGRLLSTPSLRH